ncbi:proton-conducting transporter membrane subunit [Mycobacterium sp. 94-17]|uniref:proton-conducting transporter transmembrane domain-containing protein n=1 Tax=Mycobacterium sp. 94-17 TaxID=2986147 RepID=UPI002D1EEFAA|nr:proton-conducting transporter membrane subunit [Mycobacterium sp. 94-17]MEB4211217.1 proton-conducting transporter membrane subunit [Mycobacterium sp. 94-17]
MLIAGLALFAAAALFSACAGRGRARGTRDRLSAAAWIANIAGAAVLVVAGAAAVAGNRQQISLDGLAGFGPAALRVDPLSGLFLIVSFGVAVPALIAAAAPANQHRPRLPGAIAVALIAVATIISADHLFVLLFGWELLTVAFYLIAGYDRDLPGRARGSVITVIFGRASGAALFIGALLLAAHTHTFAFTAGSIDPHSAAGQTSYAFLLLGFGIKVGLLPAHIWMPRGYFAAPGPARAVIAGSAVNVGFYGMWRTLNVFGAPPVWLVCVVLLVGGLTAVLGIAHAAVNPDLATLISWSSVENAGMITAGFGVALAGAAAHEPKLAAAGLVAGTAQVMAHALGKTLMFVSTSTIEHTTGTTELDRLGGIVRSLPWAGAGLVIGSLTLAGLPLTAGFASEWFTLESLMQQFRVTSLAMQLSTAATGALIALTIGIAGVTFVRVVALTAFGPSRINEPRLDPSAARVDRQWPYRFGVAVLVVGCLGVAAVAPLQVGLIARGLRPIVGDHAAGANGDPWVLQPVFAKFSALSPSWLWIVLPAMTMLIAAFATAFAGRNLFRARVVSPWSSASPGVDRGVGYTSSGYANPVRNVLATVLLTRTALLEAEEEPDNHEDSAHRYTYRIDVVDVVERYFYRPLSRGVLAVSRSAKKLQSGRLDAYMAYMLIAVLAVLAVVIATS